MKKEILKSILEEYGKNTFEKDNTNCLNEGIDSKGIIHNSHDDRRKYMMNDDWSFTRVDSKSTDLGVDIFVDDNQSYKNFHHPLWLCVNGEHGQVAVIVSDRPCVLGSMRDADVTIAQIKKIQKFIIRNEDILKRLADGMITYKMFIGIIQQKSKLHEQATLHPDDSHLPTVLWLDENRQYLPHCTSYQIPL